MSVSNSNLVMPCNCHTLPLLCLRGWIPKGEGDEDPQIKEGNKENKVHFTKQDG